jgi:molybdopterin molybdotransferase
MMTVEQAQREVLSRIQPLGSEAVGISCALFRTLAEPVACDIDYPPFDRSVMDGFAVRSDDVLEVPATLRVVGQIPAGQMATQCLGVGEAMQINTGAAIPSGADAVARVEITESVDGGRSVRITESVPLGKFITQRGAHARAGDVALNAGTLITASEVAVAATAGAAELNVYRRPRVAHLATGDELVDVAATPVGAQIRNSNQHALADLIRTSHADPVSLGTVGDDRDALRAKIEEGLQYDVFCITGGISMGAFDFVPEVLEQCGVSFHVRKMSIKPGRPTIFGTTDRGTLVFALPGNPVSAFVGFEVLVKPALSGLCGRSHIPPPIKAILDGELAATTNRRSYFPVSVRVDDDGAIVAKPLSWGGSGDPVGMAGADGFATRAADSPSAVDGDRVDVLLFGQRS